MKSGLVGYVNHYSRIVSYLQHPIVVTRAVYALGADTRRLARGRSNTVDKSLPPTYYFPIMPAGEYSDASSVFLTK